MVMRVVKVKVIVVKLTDGNVCDDSGGGIMTTLIVVTMTVIMCQEALY